MNKTTHPDFNQARPGVLLSSKMDEFVAHRDRRSLGKKVIDLEALVAHLAERVARLEAASS